MKKLDFFRKCGLIIKNLAGINVDYFTRSEALPFYHIDIDLF
ncbi:MAG: hypothetical protein AB1765_10530 [Candidatus Hydrogenedentota bacterium]